MGPARAARPHRRRPAGRVPVQWHRARQPDPRPGGHRARGGGGGGRAGQRRPLHPPAGGLRRRAARTRQQPVERATPAARLRPGAGARSHHPRARRGHFERRPGDRMADPGRAREAARGAHGAGDRPPPVDDRERRPYPGAPQGRAARAGDAPRAPGARRALCAALPRAVRARRRAPRARRRAVVRRGILAAGLCVGLAGCGAGYLVHAGWSEARILLARRPITTMLAEPDLDATLRERLTLALAVREFAGGPLGLRVGESYTTFARVDRDATVWVVSAARRDRLEAVEWRYPLVGRLPYRGFFDRSAAERAADRLAQSALDTEVRPAVAFSTLGWFADPLLSTVTDGSPVEVAETVIHELFHAPLYLPGAATFNESAATFAGYRGAQAFFCSGPGADPAACDQARRRWRIERARGRIFGHLAARLRRLYASQSPGPATQRARTILARAAAARLVRRRLGAASELVPPNNARLLGVLVYLTDLDGFDRLAPTDQDLGPALARLVAAAREAPDPFAVVGGRSETPSGVMPHGQIGQRAPIT